jgi:hypothetical protein
MLRRASLKPSAATMAVEEYAGSDVDSYDEQVREAQQRQQ